MVASAPSAGSSASRRWSRMSPISNTARARRRVAPKPRLPRSVFSACARLPGAVAWIRAGRPALTDLPYHLNLRPAIAPAVSFWGPATAFCPRLTSYTVGPRRRGTADHVEHPTERPHNPDRYRHAGGKLIAALLAAGGIGC